MTGKLLLPPQYESITGPLVFLAGPIQGAPDWQSQAIAFFQDIAPALHIACPRLIRPTGKFDFNAQVDWETHHLRRAATEGAILFWLACEVEHDCSRAYAQTTRFELAEWKMRHERDGTKLVVGVQEGFSGAKYIRRRFQHDCPNVPIVASLEEACQAVVAIVSR